MQQRESRMQNVIENVEIKRNEKLKGTRNLLQILLPQILYVLLFISSLFSLKKFQDLTICDELNKNQHIIRYDYVN